MVNVKQKAAVIIRITITFYAIDVKSISGFAINVKQQLLQLYIIFIKVAELKIAQKKDRTNIICANRVKKNLVQEKKGFNGTQNNNHILESKKKKLTI